MLFLPTLSACVIALSITSALHAQNTMEDGTALLWEKEITVGRDSLPQGSVRVAAWTVPVYEAKPAQVWALLKTELVGADFKKQGQVMRAPAVSYLAVSSTPVDILAQVREGKDKGESQLSLTFLVSGTSEPVDGQQAEAAMRDLGVKVNKAVVQAQVDQWKKKLDKASVKSKDAEEESTKVQEHLSRTQAQLGRSSSEKNKLLDEHAVLQKDIDLLNQKWTLSQKEKDLKKLTKARKKITKNEAKMAQAMNEEAQTQKALVKNADDLPDAQKAKEQKTADQAEVQRRVDALQLKLENIR